MLLGWVVYQRERGISHGELFLFLALTCYSSPPPPGLWLFCVCDVNITAICVCVCVMRVLHGFESIAWWVFCVCVYVSCEHSSYMAFFYAMLSITCGQPILCLFSPDRDGRCLGKKTTESRLLGIPCLIIRSSRYLMASWWCLSSPPLPPSS